MLYSTLSVPPEKYFKGNGDFFPPQVDWSNISDSYALYKKDYNSSYFQINRTIGSVNENGIFSVKIVVNIDYLDLVNNKILIDIYAWFDEIQEKYIVKDFIFKYKLSDGNVGLLGTGHPFKTGNQLYYYVENMSSYEYNYVLPYIKGINKEKVDVKQDGISEEAEVEINSWTNHTITLTATLYYGHPTMLGWQDVHELSTSVKIYVVSE